MAKITEKESSRVALLLAELESIKTVSNGKASFKGWGFRTVRVFISRLVIFNRNIPEIDKNNLVQSALFAAASAGKLSNKTFITALNQKENEYFELPNNQFRLVTQVGLDPRLCPKRLKSLNSIISFNIDKNSALYRKHSKSVAHVSRLQVPCLPSRYTPLSVSCVARTANGAFEEAATALDFWRGCYNLGINRGKSWRICFDRRAPVNAVLLHPVATIHHPNGRLADSSWYFDAAYQVEFRSLSRLQDRNKGQRHFIILREKLRGHPYAEPIIRSITRYGRALDGINWESAYVQLWSICEELTLATGHHSENIIKSIKSNYQNEKYVDIVLQVLKEFRNRAVHLGEETQDIETLLFQLKCFVEDLICFHAFNRFNFESLEQAVESLALGTDLKTLVRKRSLIDKAISRNRWILAG